jgi:hypothetical protein
MAWDHQDPWAAFRVADEALAKTAECIDIVTADMHNANCFTKSYGKYVKGTGSVLATQNLFLLNGFLDWSHREEVSRCTTLGARDCCLLYDLISGCL